MKNLQAGLGIIELLLGLTITAIVGIGLTGIITSSNNFFLDQTVQVNQGLSLNTTAREITDLIKSSAGVVGQYPLSGSPMYQTGNNVLILRLPAISSTGQIIESVFDYAIITREPTDSNILRMRVFVDNLSNRSSADTILSTSLKSVRFLYLDVSNLQVSPSQAARVNFIINLSESAGLSDSESSASGIVNLKNH